jgi:hypothetical protein
MRSPVKVVRWSEEVRLPPWLKENRSRRELMAFVRYCVKRLERELGTLEGWEIAIEPQGQHLVASVSAHVNGEKIQARGDGHDAPLAIWNAMCRLEQPLRDALWSRRAA